VADFVYFDACIPSIPLLDFLSCYILHIVKKPLIVLFHVHPCFFIFCGCAYLLCPVVFSWTRTGRSGAAARVVSVIPARALPITYFWALLQKEKERPFIQWGTMFLRRWWSCSPLLVGSLVMDSLSLDKSIMVVQNVDVGVCFLSLDGSDELVIIDSYMYRSIQRL